MAPTSISNPSCRTSLFLLPRSHFCDFTTEPLEHRPHQRVALELRAQFLTAGQEEREQHDESLPTEAPGDRRPDRERRGEAAPGEPAHSSNNSRRMRSLSSEGAPCARQRARRKSRNSRSKSKCSPHGGQSARC